MTNQRLTDLFRKYTSNSCSPEERKELIALIQQEENAEELEKLLDNEWNEKPEELQLNPTRAEYIFNKVVSNAPQKRKLSIHRSIWWSAAASILLLIAWGISTRTLQSTNLISKPSTETLVSGNSNRFFILPDGSKVTLNNETQLIIENGLEGKTREVTLKGEAYFDIAEDPSRPFIVHTDSINVTVLGTAFNVKAYHKDDISVTVNRGKVRVSKLENPLATLLPNQQFVLYKSGKSNFEKQLDANVATQWQHKELIFDDVPMSEAAMVLEARFGKKIIFTNKQVAACHFSSTFLKDEKLEQILEVLCAFNNANYQLKNDEIIIDGSGCEPEKL